MGRLLAVDLGTKRTGLALSDPLQVIASPFKTLRFTSDRDLLKKITLIAQEKKVETVIIGLPIREDGREGLECIRPRKFRQMLESQHIQTVLWDERYSSRMAESVIHEHGKKTKNLRHAVDGIAASFILASYMQSREQ